MPDVDVDAGTTQPACHSIPPDVSSEYMNQRLLRQWLEGKRTELNNGNASPLKSDGIKTPDP